MSANELVTVKQLHDALALIERVTGAMLDLQCASTDERFIATKRVLRIHALNTRIELIRFMRELQEQING